MSGQPARMTTLEIGVLVALAGAALVLAALWAMEHTEEFSPARAVMLIGALLCGVFAVVGATILGLLRLVHQ